MKTHFVLPFPVNYIGECIRTVPYTAADYARWGAEHQGASQCSAQHRMERVGLTAENGVLIEDYLQCNLSQSLYEELLHGWA